MKKGMEKREEGKGKIMGEREEKEVEEKEETIFKKEG